MFLHKKYTSYINRWSLRDREVACSASDRQGSNFESCVLRTVSSQSSHHPHEVLLAQFSLYVHKGGLKPDSFHLYINCYSSHWFLGFPECLGGGPGAVVNPLTAKLFTLNFHPLEVVSRWRDPHIQESENYSDLTKWRSTVFKSCWLMSLFIFNRFNSWYLMC